MNVQLGVQIEVEKAAQIKDRLDRLRGANAKALEANEKRLKLGDKKALDHRKRLVTERSYISHNNVLRIAIDLGLAALAKEKDDALIRRLADTGLRRGRPSPEMIANAG